MSKHWVQIAKTVVPFGLKGELKCYALVAEEDLVAKVKKVYLKPPDSWQNASKVSVSQLSQDCVPNNTLASAKKVLGTLENDEAAFSVEKIRRSGKHFLLQLAGLDSLDSVQRWRGFSVYCLREDLATASDDFVYVQDLIGKSAYREEQCVGQICAVYNNGGQLLMEIVSTDQKLMLLPCLPSTILDVGEQKVDLDFPLEFLELNAASSRVTKKRQQKKPAKQ